MKPYTKSVPPVEFHQFEKTNPLPFRFVNSTSTPYLWPRSRKPRNFYLAQIPTLTSIRAALREQRYGKLADVKKTPPPQTGPRTRAGKEHSSQNSTTHGLCGNPAKFLPGETQEQYNAIRDIWFAEYDSEAPGTARLLEPLINSDRMMRFAADAVTDAHTALSLAEAAAQPDYARIEMLHNDLKNKLRYKADHERSFQRALRNIEQFGQRRTREDNAAQHLKIISHKVAFGTAVICKSMGIGAEIVHAIDESLWRATPPVEPQPECTP